MCKLRKIHPIPPLVKEGAKKSIKDSKYFVADDGVQSTVCKYLRESFGIIVDKEKYLFVRTPHHICVTSPAFKSMI